MTRPALTAIPMTIVKLLRLLASDKPGEIVATAHAMRRVLNSAGLDLHDVANAIEDVATRRGALRPEPIPTPAGNDNPLEMIRCCYRHADLLSTKELKFVRSMSNWCREPTIHQMRKLRPLYQQCLKLER